MQFDKMIEIMLPHDTVQLLNMAIIFMITYIEILRVLIINEYIG